MLPDQPNSPTEGAKRKWPTKGQWLCFFGVLSKKEKIIFPSLAVICVVSLIALCLNLYWQNTKIGPGHGGSFTEGIIGQPRFINPVYANSDADRDLVQLVFSGLMKYDGNLGLVPDLASKYDVQDNGKVYDFYLKDGLLWQDKTPLTADDVIFTIKTIQNPDYNSPLRADWIGVDAEKINDNEVRFTLSQPYASFLENLTLKIIPQHIWENVSPQNFALEINYNLNPIGSGPYRIQASQSDKNNKITSITLAPNAYYYQKDSPKISQIKLEFFDSQEQVLKAAKSNSIDAFSSTSFINMESGWNDFQVQMPRYFAIFFNQNNSKILADSNIRQALSYATDQKSLAQEMLGANDQKLIQASAQTSPLLPDFYGLSQPSNSYSFDLQKAKDLLDKDGFNIINSQGLREEKPTKVPAFTFKSNLKLGSKGTEVKELQSCLAEIPGIYASGKISGTFDADTQKAVTAFQEKYADDILKPQGFTEGTGEVSKSTRTELNNVCFPESTQNIPLQINIVTADQPQLVQLANILKKQWAAAGIDLQVQTFSLTDLEQDYIKPRNYQALIFGEVLGAIPDPYPFWDSVQKLDPGLNLSLYSNKKADTALEDNRQSSDPKVKTQDLQTVENFISQDIPAIVLYSPNYLYFVSKEIKGININKIIEPSGRFSSVGDWYIKTTRIWK